MEMFNQADSLLKELKFIGPIESTDDLIKGLEILDVSRSNFVKVCSVNHEWMIFRKNIVTASGSAKIIYGTSFSEDYEAIIFNSLAKEISSRHKEFSGLIAKTNFFASKI